METSQRTKANGEELDLKPSDRVRPDRLTLISFAIFVVLVAGNVIAIKFSNQELPPFWGAGMRFLAASLLFFLYVGIRRLPLPRGRALLGVLLFGILQFGVGFALGYWALLEVPAGLASVILASVPLFTLLFAYATRLEPLRVMGIIGALIAIGGMAIMYGERAGQNIPTAYLLATVATAVCFASVPVIVKSFPPVHPATTNALGMFIGALLLLSLSFAISETRVIPTGLATRIAYLYLVTLGSIGVFGLYLFILGRWTASGTSYQAVLTPPVTIALSAWLLGEPLTWGLIIGGVVVLVGVYFGITR